MRIVELATNDTLGGAARSAYRLHEGLRARGVDARMLARWKHSNDRSVAALHAAFISADYATQERATRQRWVRDNRTEHTDTLFSLGQPSIDIAMHPLLRSADLVHLHWIANFLGPSSFASLARIRQPIVWTLHDEWGYTGGCHYTAGCEQFRTQCMTCPQLREDPLGLVQSLFQQRCAAWAGANLTVVTPSRWLAQRAKSSAVLGAHRIEVIPYGLDHTVFAPASDDAIAAFRRRIGIAADEVVFAFGVDRLGERRKGADHLRDALAIVRAAGVDPVVLRFGDATGSDAPSARTIDLGPIQDDRALALVYHSTDAFILPTLEDNLPNGVLESMASGTAVIAYATGGVPDLIDDGVHGWLAPTGDVRALAAVMRQAAGAKSALRAAGAAGRARIMERHTLAHQAECYIALYKDVYHRASREAVA